MRRPSVAFLLMLVAAALLGGCKSKSRPAEKDIPDGKFPPGDVSTDAGDARVEPQDSWDLRDVPGKDVEPDLGPDTVEPDGKPYVPVECASHADCEGEGLCVEVAPGSGKTVCAPFCIDECPGDWQCKSIYVDGPDPVSLCFPPTETICKVCSTDKECLFAAALCLKGSGATGFCGKYCHPQESPECPQGFECRMAKGKNGENLGYQCQPPLGSCCIAGKMKSCDDGNPCTSDSCDPSTGCKYKNIDGPCQGSEPCTVYKCVNGACIGMPITVDDTLDGKDDDCDGLTDEDWVTGLKVPVWGFASMVHKATGGGITVRGSLSTPPAAGTASGGDFRVTPGMNKVKKTE